MTAPPPTARRPPSAKSIVLLGNIVGMQGRHQESFGIFEQALALDPRILILDDTLSAVDAETEAAIRRELRQVFQGRTVVVVASRVSAVQTADRIVVLDQGRVVESGSHQELTAAGGLYARLAREQAEEERLEGVA